LWCPASVDSHVGGCYFDPFVRVARNAQCATVPFSNFYNGAFLMSVAANRYARALIDILYPEKAEAGYHQLEQFLSLLNDQPDVRRFLENPTTAGERRKRLLSELSSALKMDQRVANFIGILVDRDRLPIFEEIVETYQKFLDEKLGIVRARVTAAQSLDAGQQEELTARLQKATGKHIRMEVAVDASLIGGVVAQVGSTIYDGSVRQQLQAFKSRLSEE
jgi:F-type H+-transporting ATPase subunit delta